MSFAFTRLCRHPVKALLLGNRSGAGALAGEGCVLPAGGSVPPASHPAATGDGLGANLNLPCISPTGLFTLPQAAHSPASAERRRRGADRALGLQPRQTAAPHSPLAPAPRWPLPEKQ